MYKHLSAIVHLLGPITGRAPYIDASLEFAEKTARLKQPYLVTPISVSVLFIRDFCALIRFQNY